MSDNPEKDLPLPPLEGKRYDEQIELRKLHYQAQLQAVLAQKGAEIEDEKALQAKIDTLDQAVHNAYLDVAKGHLDRVRVRAEFVEKAAGTIGGAYAILLGLSFSLNKEVNRPLPARGLAPTIFLGLSIFLAAVYLAYITPTQPLIGPKPHPVRTQRVIQRRDAFILWTSEIVGKRARWLQSAVISLGFGVIFLPVVFLDIQNNIVWIAVAVGLVLALLLPNVKFLFKRLLSPPVWPKNAEEAAKLFGGKVDRWELSNIELQWYLKPGDLVTLDTHGLLAAGYNGDPAIPCYAWIGKQTVTVATIYRDSSLKVINPP
jgi:hypothetical protein